MKRRLLIILLLLVGGAIVNVAVAWGCALWSGGSIGLAGVRSSQVTDDEVVWWRSRIPDIDPYPSSRRSSFEYDYFYHSTSFGLDSREVALLQGYAVTSTAAGWPFRTAYAERVFASGVRQDIGLFHASWLPYREDRYWLPLYGRFLPLMPIWRGFAINMVFYAAVLWGLFNAAFALRSWRRINRGLCPKCAYDLRGSSGGRCPECGARVRAKTFKPPEPNRLAARTAARHSISQS